MQTIQSLKERAASVKKKMVAKKDAADATKLRAMRKRLKRTQRRARSLSTQEKRLAEKASKKEKAAES